MGKNRSKAWDLARRIITSFKHAGAKDASVTEHGLEMLESLFGMEDEEKHKQQMDELRAKAISGIKSIMPYASKADSLYYELIANDLREVPAVNMYDGEYSLQLENLIEVASKGDNPQVFEQIHSDMEIIATKVQAFLNEDTSDVDYARWWQAKFVDAYKAHLQNQYYDATLSDVMQAYRRFAETGQYLINSFGSENLINATYEAVTDGANAFEFINKILDYDNTSFTKGGISNVIVPYAGFFN